MSVTSLTLNKLMKVFRLGSTNCKRADTMSSRWSCLKGFTCVSRVAAELQLSTQVLSPRELKPKLTGYSLCSRGRRRQMPASEPHRLSDGLHAALAVRSGLQRLNGFISKEYGKASEQKESKKNYAAFPAGISETPKMNNQFQHLFPSSGNDVYITLGDGHSIHDMSCGLYRLSGVACTMLPKAMRGTVQAGLLTRQDIASMHTHLRKQ